MTSRSWSALCERVCAVLGSGSMPIAGAVLSERASFLLNICLGWAGTNSAKLGKRSFSQVSRTGDCNFSKNSLDKPSRLTKTFSFPLPSQQGLCLPLSNKRCFAQGADTEGEESQHDPLRTRIIHFMVLGTLLASGSSVLPYMGLTSVENSAKLLASTDALMQHAGADRLCRLARLGADRRAEITGGPALGLLMAKVSRDTDPRVLEASLGALRELLAEDDARAAMAANTGLLAGLRALADAGDGPNESAAAAVLKDVLRPPLHRG
mmetsp:Transcript_43097/g.102314  ORF Transcript_43097/g.102314 Transcript_43097/m.102314 type:complete len:266 (+) Transcript_43097:527-1324(+)